MSEGIPYADLIILALVAGFIILRLRSVLGSKDGSDTKNFFNRRPALPDAREPALQLKDKLTKSKPEEEIDTYLAGLNDVSLSTTLNTIKAKDLGFNATAFLNGAKAAFEMVFDAFAKGDKATLKMLMSPLLYDHFASEIDKRASEDNKPEATLVSIESKDITDARLENNLAHLSVRFTSEQIAIVRAPDGEIIEGDPSRVDRVIDEWQFERDITSKNPNWKIVET